MTPEMLDAIARRFQFERWAGVNTLGRELYVRNYRIPPPAPGWELVRAWNVPPLEDSPPALQTIWSSPSAGAEALLRVDVYECASREAAHRHMLRLLGDHEVEGAGEVTADDLGDVFSTTRRGETAVFARGNLVIFIARAGIQPAETRGVATTIDSDIVSEPAAELGRGVSVTQSARAAAEGGAESVAVPETIELETLDETSQATLKIFADGGEVFESSGRIEMRVTDPARANAVVYTLPADGGPSRMSVREEENE
jgi:hypothetical protein